MNRQQTFCCCCNIRTGTLVIGTAGWVFTLLQIFLILGPAVYRSNQSPIGDIDDNEINRALNKYQRHMNEQIFAEIGVAFVYLLLCVLLIVGVYKKDKRYILPWLVLKAFEGILLILGTIGIFIIAFFAHDERVYAFGLSAGCAIVTVIGWYCWCCVYTHYRELGEGVPNDGMPPVYYSSAPPAYQEQEKSKYGFA